MPRAVLGICFLFVASMGGLLGLLAGSRGVPLGRTLEASGRPAPHAPASGPPSFADIVASVNPAVVHITVVEGTGRSATVAHGLPGVRAPRRGEGSGFIVDRAGYILTNQHLVESSARIRVRLADKREVPATLVGADSHTDLALLKVEGGDDLPTIPLGDSDTVRVGDWVCAIGNPYHFDHSVTVGVVSSKGRKIFDASFDAYIQTDAAINPGNSGGPLINAAGEVVGISAAVSREGQGIGFAVPINVARDILDQLRTRGRVSRGYLGVQLQELDPDLRELIRLPGDRGGVMVVDVIPGGAGQKAGLQRYDVILTVSGRRIDDGDHLVRTIAARPPGSGVALTVFRDGREIALDARLNERGSGDQAPAAAAGEPEVPTGDALGLEVAELSAQMRSDLQIPEGRTGVVVRDIVGLSPGVENLAHGDLIVEVNRRPTPDLAAYDGAVGSLRRGERAWLFVYRPRPPATFLAKVEVEGGRRR
jgi:Do/DeqQ family serine protease